MPCRAGAAERKKGIGDGRECLGLVLQHFLRQATAREKREGGGDRACGGCVGPCNCEGEAQRAGGYLLLLVVVGMVVCLAGML